MEVIIESLEPKRFKAGEYIFKEGEPSSDVYLINQGEVEIVKEKNGEEIILATRRFNEIFGEMALFFEPGERSASARAKKDTWCYVMSEEAFKQHVNELDSFMKGIVNGLVRLVRDTTETNAKLTAAKLKTGGWDV
jgi:CRP-like cAMP-binding protein